MKKVVAVLLCCLLLTPAAVFAEDAPFACWLFEGSSSDSGANGFDGVVSGEAQFVDGAYGKALDAAKSGICKVNGLIPALEGAAAVTVAGSFRNDDLPPGDPKQYVITKMLINGNNGGFNLYIENGKLIFEARSMPADKMQSVSVAYTDTGNWHDFIAVADYENAKMTLYLDGAEVASKTAAFGAKKFTPGAPASPDFTMGGAGSNRLNGAVDAFYLFDRAASAEEIAGLLGEAGSGETPVEKRNPYIVGAWSLNEASAEDSRGKKLSFSAEGYTTAEGKFGGGLEFAGRETPLAIGKEWGGYLNGSQYITASLWFCNNTMPETGSYSLLRTMNGARAGFELQLIPNGLQVTARSAVHDRGCVVTFPFSGAGEWHHVIAAVDFSAPSVRLYLDGAELAGSGTVAFAEKKYTVAHINSADTLGGFTRTSMFDGKIDELALLTKPVDEEEVQSLFTLPVEEATLKDIILREVDFTDIADSWAAESITAVAARGLMNGTDEAHFSPTLHVTRADYFQLLAALAEWKPAAYRQVVKDIPASAGYAGVFQTAYDRGLIDVHLLKNQRFAPDSPITLGDAAALTARLCDALGVEAQDASTVAYAGGEAWMEPFLRQMDAAGLFAGVSAQGADAGRYLTRADVADILFRILELL